ncbi:tetracycline-efflux transporter [Fusarium albosuccineum]|uniref:Tetracycline-efflux transporter n=1 Tax=Fusarium albosuccineum TaxID=1237068 RepID=A0A8H4LR94_9HYPO|nr:tetracycline-efflux transporter [Fusarium albosuccineum]
MTRAKDLNGDAIENPSVDVTETTRLLSADGPETRDGDSVSSSSSGWDGYKDFEGLPWWHRPSVFWLLGPYAIFTLAFGGVIVPKLNLQYFADKKTHDPDAEFNPVLLGSDNPQCLLPDVQRNVATFMLVMNFVTGILSAIVAPRIGHLSDRYGRTRLMALASVGGVLAELITILAAKYPEVVNYRWLVLGSIFDGMTGSFTAGNIMCQSYTSDCTPPSKRAVFMGYLHACLFTGLAFGPLLAGYFVKWTGSLLSIFYVVMGCHAAFMLFVWLVVPESLSRRKQLLAREKWDKEVELRGPVSASWLTTLRTVNPFAPLKILWPTGPGTSPGLRRNLVALAADDAIMLGAALSAGAVILLYCESTFHWGNLESSKFVSALSLIRVVVLLGIYPLINYFGRVRPAARRRRESGVAAVEKITGADNLDVWVLRLALMSDVLGSVGYIVSRSEGFFVASGMVTAMGGLGSATSQAIISKHVPSERVGQLLGAIGMLHALARVLGPVLFNGLYAITVGFYPQAIFVLLTSIFGAGLLASFLIRPHVVWEDEPEEERGPLNAAQEAFNTGTDQLPIDEDQVRFQ